MYCRGLRGSRESRELTESGWLAGSRQVALLEIVEAAFFSLFLSVRIVGKVSRGHWSQQVEGVVRVHKRVAEVVRGLQGLGESNGSSSGENS